MDWLEKLTAITVVANSLWILWSSWKKNKPEIKKLESEAERADAEIETEFANAAQVLGQGAKISVEVLLGSIVQLRADLENEKKSRREDAEYFKRRFREAEREARDYRAWAAKLARQVIEAGKIPAPFLPSMTESEPGIAAIVKDEPRKDA